jgi:phospho-N-acetylmuramoyl-pentapeptide-transferase
MLYHLSQIFKYSSGFFNIFHYVSVRVISALLTSIIFSFILGDWFVRASKRRFRSKVREWIPQTHDVKNNTPTMGGLFILLVLSLNMLLWCDLTNLRVWLFFFGVLGFGLIGFVDDWAKIKKNKGISARLKFSLQFFVATVVTLLWYFLLKPDAHLCIPFFKNLNPYLGLLLIPWAIFIIIGTSNAVNLTDGLDGLATGPLMFSFSTFAVIAYLAGHKYFAMYLYIPFAGTSDLAVLGATLVGALLGFLWYNTYPAQIFMGDVGALAMGAGLGLMALFTRQELLLPITGGIFVLETLSVIIQVFSYKVFGKRVFKMAPIHHHYELMGWKESKITIRFWIISIILSVITLLTLKIR